LRLLADLRRGRPQRLLTRHTAAGTPPALEHRQEAFIMYSILYIIGAIVVIIVVLKLLGLY
jgi:hypothetical protein